MRAFLVLLMLTLLPLQFAAASAAECCGHVETASKGSHNPADDSAHSAFGLDDHCGVCHAHGAALLMPMAQTMVEPAGAEQGEHRVQPILPPWPARPDRPKWFAPHGSGFDASA